MLALAEAAAELAGDRESVLGVAFNGKGVAGRWHSVEEFNVTWPVLDSLAEHVDDAAPAYFALEACQKLAVPKAVGSELEALVGMRLGLDSKAKELRQVHGVLAVLVIRVATDPTLALRGGACLAVRA